MAVYEKYYHCRQEPFSLSPNPAFVYDSASHREAFGGLSYVVDQRKGFAIVTGEVGTGKTLLLRRLIESCGPKVQTAYFINPPISRAGLYMAIANELDMGPCAPSDSPIMLNRRFLEICEKGSTTVLIFDEAQSIQPAILEQIRLLTNLETSNAKLVQVILAGQPEFDTMIDSRELRALRQRAVLRLNLIPLDAVDTRRYVANRLFTAGAASSLFTENACRAVHHYSRGIPRLINLLCDNAMIAGYALDKQLIKGRLIQEVAIDLKLVKTSRRSNRSIFNRIGYAFNPFRRDADPGWR
jgi:general secretion pathway protein A